MSDSTRFFGGEIIGIVRDAVFDAAGVQYAELARADEPFGAARLTRPRQVEAAAFPQSPGGLDWLLGEALSELPQHVDAFQLRVQGPVGAKNAPVLVFVPGGGFLSGSGNARWYSGGHLVRSADAIVVTVNYRLGAWGFLDPFGKASGANRGISDVVLALEWIREHIHEFGGDPANVTLSGDSAGAWIVQALATSPLATGLFRRAMLVSAPGDAPLSAEAYAERNAVLRDAYSGRDAANPVERMLRAQGDLAPAFRGRGLPVFPVLDGDLVTEWAAKPECFGAHTHVSELLVVTTADEGQAFVAQAPEEAFSEAQVRGLLGASVADSDRAEGWLRRYRPGASPKQLMGDALTLTMFRQPAVRIAESAASAGIPVRLVRLHGAADRPGAGAPHCFAVPVLFQNPEHWADASMLAGVDSARFAASAARVAQLVHSFLRGASVGPGDPRATQDHSPVQTEEIGLADGAATESDDWILDGTSGRSA